MKTIKRALLSCTDKTGLVDFAKFLESQNVELLSTGGTAKLLRDAGLTVKDVSDHTGFPEMMDGRVKTLHPKIHGGLLGLRDNESHQSAMKEHGILPIDMVVVNLYAFAKTIENPNVTLEEAIENIDIGGPSMLRSAAKNYRDVVVVTDPLDYPCLQEEWQSQNEISLKTRSKLALKVFQKTNQYDLQIAKYLETQIDQKNTDAAVNLDSEKEYHLEKVTDLRYGENPHQKSAFYKVKELPASGFTNATQIQGKALSFNNILDTDACYRCCKEFTEPTAVIVKHNNPCGVASAKTLSEAFLKARATDPISCFGGIVAVNGKIEEDLAQHIVETFFEVILAPDFSDEALALFSKKKNLRVLKFKDFKKVFADQMDLRFVSGGVLVQEMDLKTIDVFACEAATKLQPNESELASLDFAWKVVKHVKSNAIVFAKDNQILGIGAGQMSRVDSVKFAIEKAKTSFENQDILQGSVVASDAFFPFRDNIDYLAKYGVKAIVQPGGSVRDQEVIAACEEYGISMIFTKVRHFKH